MKATEKNVLMRNLRMTPAHRIDMTVIDDDSDATEKKAALKRLEREFRTGGKRIRIVSTEA